MKLLSGIKTKNEIDTLLKSELDILKKKNIIPTLSVILVGNDPASIVYVNAKKRACRKLGINFIEKKIPETAKHDDVLELVQELNKSEFIDGFICQVPLPNQCDRDEIINSIDPKKDVDCFHSDNFKLIKSGNIRFVPCTIYGALQIIKHYKYNLHNQIITIISKSRILEKLLSALLPFKEYNSLIFTEHPDILGTINSVCSITNIMISAIGQPNLITKHNTKKNSIVIDIGISKIKDKIKLSGFRVVGDTDLKSVENHITAITPVPGGVGPMTVSMLMYNTINAARLQNNLPLFKLP